MFFLLGTRVGEPVPTTASPYDMIDIPIYNFVPYMNENLKNKNTIIVSSNNHIRKFLRNS